MRILVTGAAGFIGFHLCRRLLADGHQVAGVDGMTPYYDPALKEARLAQLAPQPGFTFERLMLEDMAALTAAFERARPEIVVHLAAQAGVRYSLENPRAYVDANLVGTFNVLELARAAKLAHLLLASTSSIYGASEKRPFEETDRADYPLTLYAASKKAGELMSHSYSHLWDLPTTAFRFFTVYGPWGRPDMAYYLFTDTILAGRPIDVFNNGEMSRDFTYIDDTISAVVAALEQPPGEAREHRIYNIGNNQPETLLDFIATLERALGRTAIRKMMPMQVGDVASTYADIEAARRDLGFEPKTSISEGIPKFIAWYREYHGLA
jgi:UDP-glucuronate 4-epimerase